MIWDVWSWEHSYLSSLLYLIIFTIILCTLHTLPTLMKLLLCKWCHFLSTSCLHCNVCIPWCPPWHAGFPISQSNRVNFAQKYNQRLAKPRFGWVVSCFLGFSIEVFRSITFALHGNLIVVMIYILIWYFVVYGKFYQSAQYYLVLLVCGPLATFPSLSSDELCSFIPAVTGALVVLFVVVVVFHPYISGFYFTINFLWFI